MALYGRSDLRSVAVGGGCGQPHAAGDGEDLVLDCPPCEEAILADPRLSRFWSDDPEEPVLTDAEAAVREKMREREERIEAIERLERGRARETSLPAEAKTAARKTTTARRGGGRPRQTKKA